MAFDGCSIRIVEQRLQHREIVLEFVDGARGILWCGPGEAGAALERRLFPQFAVVRYLSGDRAHHVERIKRRHARPRFADIQSWIRNIQTLRRGADRNLQQQALRGAALIECDERGIEPLPRFVQKQRIFVRTLRHHALGESGDENDAERTAAGLVRRAHEHAAVPPRRRFPVERRESIVQQVAHAFEAIRDPRRPSGADLQASSVRDPVSAALAARAHRAGRAIHPTWSCRASRPGDR